MLQDPSSQANVETVFGDLFAKIRYGMIVELEESFKAILFHSSGQHGPGYLTSVEKDDCFLIKSEGKDFKVKVPGGVPTRYVLPNTQELEIPKGSRFQPSPGAYCYVACVVCLPYDSRIRLLDVLLLETGCMGQENVLSCPTSADAEKSVSGGV